MSKFRLCQWKFPELSTHGVPGLLNTTRPSLRPRFNKIGAYELKSRIPLRHQSKFRVTNKELSQTTTPSLSQLRHNKFFMAICQAPSCQIARFSLFYYWQGFAGGGQLIRLMDKLKRRTSQKLLNRR